MFDKRTRQGLATLIMLVLTPIINIAAFNHFFDLGIPLTLGTWFLVFLVGLFVAIILVALFLASILGFAFGKGLVGVVALGATFLAIPVVYILSFNFLLETAVPITGESYIVVALVLIATMVLSGVLRGPR